MAPLLLLLLLRLRLSLAALCLFSPWTVLSRGLLAATQSEASLTKPAKPHSVASSPVSKIFVPRIFDSKENAQVVLQGYYRRSCARPLGTAFKVHHDQQHIELWASSELASQASQGNNRCKIGRYAFLQVVDLGPLPPGEYRISYRGQSQVTATPLKVSEHRKKPLEEEVLYAPVDHIAVEDAALKRAPSPGSQQDRWLAKQSKARWQPRRQRSKHIEADQGSLELGSSVGAKELSLTLVGTFPYLYRGCMRLKELQVTVNPGAVIVVKPLAEIVFAAAACPNAQETYKFTSTVVLPVVAKGPMLIHVQLQDGVSLNHLIGSPN